MLEQKSETMPVSEIQPTAEVPAGEIIEAQPIVEEESVVEQIPTESVKEDVEPEVSEEAVDDLSDSNIETADRNWINEGNDIIERDKENPFLEQVDAGNLGKDYMKERFEVDIEEDK